MAGIETDMPGSPAAVHAVADWLGRLSTQANTAAIETRRITQQSWQAWNGESGNAYRDFNRDLDKATREVKDRADDAEDKVRSYAQQLNWRQEDMAGHRDRAREGGLSVVGTVISTPPTPVSPGDLAAGSTQAEADDWERRNDAFEAANDKVELYNELLEDVRGTFERLDTWVEENLVTLEQELSSPFTITALSGAIVGYGLGLPQSKFESRSRDLRTAAMQRAEEMARKRSGNPAVRGGSKPPRQAAIDKATRPGTRAARLLGLADDAGRVGKFLARGNVVAAVVLGGIEIANGKSPSSVAVETGASLLAGAAVAGLVTAGVITAPAWGTVAIAVGVGAAAAAGAGWAYESLVPQATREKIDEGIKDAWDATGGKVVDGIGDAWNSVFG